MSRLEPSYGYFFKSGSLKLLQEWIWLQLVVQSLFHSHSLSVPLDSSRLAKLRFFQCRGILLEFAIASLLADG